MIVLARRIDPLARETRKFLEDEVDAPTTRAMEKIAQARWRVHGRTLLRTRPSRCASPTDR